MQFLTTTKGHMKTKEELTEHAGLVRDLIAAAGVDYPADDFERGLRDALFRKAFTMVPLMEVNHVRRINEALCEMEFPSATALGLRRATMTRLADHHQLKKFRNVNMPVITPPQRPLAERK